MFIDVVKIRIASGKGGDGKVNFHREKYVAAGGPDGGDGGRGGSVIFKVDDNLSTLLDFRYKKKYVALPGEPGGGKRCKGKDGADLVIRVPRGTILRDQATGQVIKDLSDDEPFVAAKGGNGGWGNSHFATPTRQTPRFAKPGQPGVEREIILELKLLADVGLVGFPNVGKSTLLSMVSAARPKIANYHFTTLIPNLGVVRVGEEQSFVMADIPGIIEGASEGAGLGHDFLRHIDRCRLLLHLVDVSGSEGRDPIEDVRTINAELAGYSEFLSGRPQILVANKTDLLGDNREPVEHLRAYAAENGFDFLELSAATNTGVQELIRKTWDTLQELPPVFIYEPEFVETVAEVTERDILVEKVEDYYVISGAWVDKLMSSVNTDDYESRMYMDRMLKNAGVYDRLEELGVDEGDFVVIGDIEFEYVR
ncbi:MAG: GTPase ObgE [Intestinibacillus sp.]